MIYISHLLPDEEMREVIEKTGAGIESIEFSIAENLDHLSETIASYQKRMKMIGTEELTVHGPFLDMNPMTFDSEIRKATKKRYEQAYTAARELGAKKIVYHSCMYPTIYYLTGWAERVVDFFREFMDGKNELEIVMENLYDREWEPLLDVVRQVEVPNFQLCLDIGHAHCYSNRPVQEWIKGLAPQITHLHLHDNCGERDEHLALGNGNIPLDQVFSALREDTSLRPGRRNFTYTIECSRKEDVLESYPVVKRLEEIL